MGARARRDDLDLLAADAWLRELVRAAGGRPPRRRADEIEAVRHWRDCYMRAVVGWSTGRRAKAIRLLGTCAEIVATLGDEAGADVARGFVGYIEARFHCVVHDDCIAYPMMAHDCWLEHPERAR